MTRADLPDMVASALKDLGGTANVARVAERIWTKYEQELREAGDLFFTWQYEMRWAAQRLRDAGRLEHIRENGRSAWRLI